MHYKQKIFCFILQYKKKKNFTSPFFFSSPFFLFFFFFSLFPFSFPFLRCRYHCRRRPHRHCRRLHRRLISSSYSLLLIFFLFSSSFFLSLFSLLPFLFLFLSVNNKALT